MQGNSLNNSTPHTRREEQLLKRQRLEESLRQLKKAHKEYEQKLLDKQHSRTREPDIPKRLNGCTQRMVFTNLPIIPQFLNQSSNPNSPQNGSLSESATLSNLTNLTNISSKTTNKKAGDSKVKTLKQSTSMPSIKRRSIQKQGVMKQDQNAPVVPAQTKYDIPTLNKVFNLKISTGWKPPHRYKTTMIEYNNKIYAYGGLGCQKLITWAVFHMNTYKWETLQIQETIENIQNRPRFSRYSHTTVLYKNKVIIYGGFILEICSQVTIFDLDKLVYSSGARGPALRDHAAAVIDKYMFVYGGLEHGNKTSNEIHVYNIESDWWSQIKVEGSIRPALSQHQMVAVSKRSKRNNPSSKFILVDFSQESIYMFGGRNEEGVCVNNFYRLKLESASTARFEVVQTSSKNPPARREHSMQYLETGYIVLYGGRTDEEVTNKKCFAGVYNDIYLFDVAKSIWVLCQVSGYPVIARFGMAAAVVGNTGVIVFGGSNGTSFNNGDVYLLETEPKKMPALHDQMQKQIDCIELNPMSTNLKKTFQKIFFSSMAIKKKPSGFSNDSTIT